MVASNDASDASVSVSNSLDEPLFHVKTVRGKLYGRLEQQSMLLEAYHRLSSSLEVGDASGTVEQQSSDSKEEFVLISGPSGTGKTLFAQSLREPVMRDGGFFISGKYDQLLRPEPYDPIVSAFTELIQLLTSNKDEAYIERVSQSSCDALDLPERTLLTNMIPALGRILGDAAEQMLPPGTGEDGRCSEHDVENFMQTFQKFTRSISSPQCPIVLFMDDLQWADTSSLNLLASLVTIRGGLVVVGSCRNNVATDSPLCVKLREMESDGVQITNVGVENLPIETVNEYVSDLLGVSPKKSKSLTEVVYQSTRGNMLHVLEFLRHLAREGLLQYNEEPNSYTWDDKEIRLLTESDSSSTDESLLIEMMIRRKLLTLSIQVQETIRVASCIGAKFDKRMVEHALSQSFSVDESLDEAVRAGLINFNPQLRMYVFTHDKIQQASYSLIERKEHFHLKIGRNLWKRLSEKDLEKNVFIVLSQLHKGSSLITYQTERYGVASLCLLAGRKSLKSSGFCVALEYLEWGIHLLGSSDDCWHEEYDLTLALYNATAEVEFVVANFDRMNELLDSVLRHANSFKDKLRAYSTRVYSLGVTKERHQAIDTGFMVLRHLGEPFPQKATRMHIIRDIVQTQVMLRGKTDESLLRLPPMTNPDKVAAMHILNLLFLHIYMLRPDYLPILICKLVRLTLKYGFCAVSSLGFAGFGVLLCGPLGDEEGGYRYGKLSLSLLDKFQTKEWLPRVYCCVHGAVISWKRPQKLSIEPLKLAYKVGLETGDIEFSMLSLNLRGYIAFHCGTPLALLEEEVQQSIEIMEAQKTNSALVMARPYLQFIRNLMGKCKDPLVMTGEAYDEEMGLKLAVEENDGHSRTSIFYQKMFLAYLFADHLLAEKMAKGCRNVEKVATGSQLVVLVLFFDGLNALALASQGVRKRKNMSIARRYIKRYRRWGQLCPQNALDKQCLLEAEYAAICGDQDRANVKYTQAISVAGEHENVYVYAIANERAGHFMMNNCNDDEMAAIYFKQAYLTYKKWGAHGKAQQLKEEVSPLQGLKRTVHY